jgi:HNH endonuclease
LTFKKGQVAWNKGLKGLNSGDKNPAWKGGRFTTKLGYVNILIPDHPNANHKGYVREHRLVMEKHLGRYLTEDEVVHHKDGNPSNNNINNLELYSKNSEHMVKNHLTVDMSDRICIRCNRNHIELVKKFKYGVRWCKMQEGWLCSSCHASIVTVARRIKNKQHRNRD